LSVNFPIDFNRRYWKTSPLANDNLNHNPNPKTTYTNPNPGELPSGCSYTQGRPVNVKHDARCVMGNVG